jgi:hypothetical protein
MQNSTATFPASAFRAANVVAFIHFIKAAYKFVVAFINFNVNILKLLTPFLPSAM